MTAPTVLATITKIENAATFTDLVNGSGDAKATFRALAKEVHPDHVPGRYARRAEAAFERLKVLYDAVASGAAGQANAPTTIISRRRAYVLGDLLAQGDIAGIYRAKYREDDETKAAALKLTRSPANADLVENEARVLRHLADKMDPKGVPYVSQLLDSFRYRDATTNVDRPVNVLTLLDSDWHTLSEVRAAYPAGLDIRDVLWMWKRALIAVGHAHRAGVVHGAITPEHLMIEGPTHGLCLVDWCYATVAEPVTVTKPIRSGWDMYDDTEEVETDDVAFAPLKAIVPKWKWLYPQNVLDKKEVSAKTDVAMASRTIATLFNDATPIRFARFARACWTAPDADAWGLVAELTELAADHFPRKYRPFSMPV